MTRRPALETRTAYSASNPSIQLLPAGSFRYAPSPARMLARCRQRSAANQRVKLAKVVLATRVSGALRSDCMCEGCGRCERAHVTRLASENAYAALLATVKVELGVGRHRPFDTRRRNTRMLGSCGARVSCPSSAPEFRTRDKGWERATSGAAGPPRHGQVATSAALGGA